MASAYSQGPKALKRPQTECNISTVWNVWGVGGWVVVILGFLFYAWYMLASVVSHHDSLTFRLRCHWVDQALPQTVKNRCPCHKLNYLRELQPNDIVQTQNAARCLGGNVESLIRIYFGLSRTKKNKCENHHKQEQTFQRNKLHILNKDN